MSALYLSEEIVLWYRLHGKTYSETKMLENLKGDADKLSKTYSQVKADNQHILRMQEKNKMFTEKKDEKALLEQENKNNDMIEHYKEKQIQIGIGIIQCILFIDLY